MDGHALCYSYGIHSPWSPATAQKCHQVLSCYIASMMPSPVTYWLQQVLTASLLLVTILLLPLVPARHVLLPLWPTSVEEVLVSVPQRTDAERRFVAAGWSTGDPVTEVARNRPLHLAIVELSDGRKLAGFPVGTRVDPEAGLDVPLPQALMAVWVERPDADAAELILLDANQQILPLPMSQIVRIYRPNQLSLVQRAAIAARRLTPAWISRRHQ